MTGASSTLPVTRPDRPRPTPSRWLTAGVAAALVISVSALAATLKRPEPPLFISVSMTTLIEEHMRATVGRNISQHEAELRTVEFSRALDAAIAELSADDGVVVLAAEAIVGPTVPDFTADIRVRTRAIAEDLARARGVSLPSLGDGSGVDAFLGRMETETDALAAQFDELERGFVPERDE